MRFWSTTLWVTRATPRHSLPPTHEPAPLPRQQATVNGHRARVFQVGVLHARNVSFDGGELAATDGRSPLDPDNSGQRGPAGGTAVLTALVGASGLVAAALVAGLFNVLGQDRPPTLDINGTCRQEGQTIVGVLRGLSPDRLYSEEIIGPDGLPYRRAGRAGVAAGVSRAGSAAWVWPCGSEDLGGAYRVRIRDRRTGQYSNWAWFEVEAR